MPKHLKFCFNLQQQKLKMFKYFKYHIVLLIWQNKSASYCFTRSPLKSKIASLKIHNASKGEPSEAHAGVRAQGLICIWHQHFAFCLVLALVRTSPPVFTCRFSLSLSDRRFSFSLIILSLLCFFTEKKSLVPALLCGSIVVLFPCIL